MGHRVFLLCATNYLKSPRPSAQRHANASAAKRLRSSRLGGSEKLPSALAAEGGWEDILQGPSAWDSSVRTLDELIRPVELSKSKKVTDHASDNSSLGDFAPLSCKP